MPDTAIAFSEIAGHPALDLVNTVEWRLNASRFEEDLLAFDDIARWSRQFDLVDEDGLSGLRALAAAAPSAAEAEVTRVRALREAIYATAFEGADPEPITAEYRAATVAGRLALDPAGARWDFPLDLALPRRRMALAAVDLLTRSDPAHLGQCHDADCGWVFLDTSPRHNRRWCVAADCGNRNRVREYYERSRAKAADSDS